MERGRLSHKTQLLVNSAVPANLRENLAPEKEFWTSNKTLSFLAEGPYFKDKENSHIRWPEVLQKMLDDSKFYQCILSRDLQKLIYIECNALLINSAAFFFFFKSIASQFTLLI